VPILNVADKIVTLGWIVAFSPIDGLKFADYRKPAPTDDSRPPLTPAPDGDPLGPVTNAPHDRTTAPGTNFTSRG